MKFKVGDVVIKKTGGNKMTIQEGFRIPPKKIPADSIFYNYVDFYRCYWFVDSELNEEEFSEDEIVTLDEYKNYLKIEEREDKLNTILKKEDEA
jgi:uncharacterized protein YodC (DUF2158 family)